MQTYQRGYPACSGMFWQAQTLRGPTEGSDRFGFQQGHGHGGDVQHMRQETMARLFVALRPQHSGRTMKFGKVFDAGGGQDHPERDTKVGASTEGYKPGRLRILGPSSSLG